MNDGNFNTFESIGTHALTTRRGRFVYVALNYATASMGRGVLSPRQQDVVWAPDGEDEALIRLRAHDGGEDVVLHVFDCVVVGETSLDDFVRNGGVL